MKIKSSWIVLLLVFTAQIVPVKAHSQAPAAQPSLHVESAQLSVRGRATVNLILDRAPYGLQRLSITIAVKDPAVVLMRAAEPRAIQSIFMIGARSTTAIVHLNIVDLYNDVRPGSANVSLALFKLEGLQAGRTELTLTVNFFVDDAGHQATPLTQSGVIIILDPSQPNLPSPPPLVPPNLPPPAPPTPAPRSLLVLESKSIVAGATEPLSLVLTKAPTGLQLLQIQLTISNPQIAQFAGVTSPTIDSRFLEILHQTPRSLEFRLVDIRKQVPAGTENVVVAFIRVRGLIPGQVVIGLQVPVFTDEAGQALAVSAQTVETQVVDNFLPPLPGARGPAKDLDGDGLYEDVDGDGQLTFADPILLAFELENPIVQAHKSFFDFNQDGKVDFADVIALAALVEAKLSPSSVVGDESSCVAHRTPYRTVRPRQNS